MFVFYVSVIFQLVLIKADSGKPMPPHLLEMSLNHMNMLLTDISNKIDFERKLLSQRDDTRNFTDFRNIDESAYDTWKRTMELKRYNTGEISKATTETYQNVQFVTDEPLAQWSTNTPVINKLFGNMHYSNSPQIKNVYQQKSEYMPDVRSKMYVDPPDARKFFTPSTVTMKSTTHKQLKKNLMAFMNKENSKYCSHDPLGQPVTANDTELCRKTIMNTTNVELPYRMAKDGMLNYLEDVIMEGLKNLATASWAGQLDPALLNLNDLAKSAEKPEISLRAKNKAVNTKSAYKKMMQHFILNHPTLFRKYAKHHKRSHKSKHHKSHHKRRHHKRKLQIEGPSKKLKGKAFKPISRINKKTKKILTRRSNSDINIKTDKTLNNIIADVNTIIENEAIANYSLAEDETEIKAFLNKSSTTKTTHSNKLVEMIRGESSYSDEEVYLKTMLKDALYHSNYTTTTTDSTTLFPEQTPSLRN